MPGQGLSCFACCPPLRPAGYDHAPWRGSLGRELADNRARFRAGWRPRREMVGFACPGLGWLDAQGRLAGCLYHPQANAGQDLRGLTGYRQKCARETCPQSRCWRALDPEHRAVLLDACRGMDAFTFSSRELNPLMGLLALGPIAAAAGARLLDQGRGEWEPLAALTGLAPHLGWPAGELARARGDAALMDPGLGEYLADLEAAVTTALGPPPPREQGSPLAELADEWRARWLRRVSRRSRARAGEVERWEALTLGHLRPDTPRPHHRRGVIMDQS